MQGKKKRSGQKDPSAHRAVYIYTHKVKGQAVGLRAMPFFCHVSWAGATAGLLALPSLNICRPQPKPSACAITRLTSKRPPPLLAFLPTTIGTSQKFRLHTSALPPPPPSLPPSPTPPPLVALACALMYEG